MPFQLSSWFTNDMNSVLLQSTRRFPPKLVCSTRNKMILPLNCFIINLQVYEHTITDFNNNKLTHVKITSFSSGCHSIEHIMISCISISFLYATMALFTHSLIDVYFVSVLTVWYTLHITHKETSNWNTFSDLDGHATSPILLATTHSICRCAGH